MIFASDIIKFIQQAYSQAGKTKAVIAVSGGIDSSVCLTLLVQALGRENVTGILLPMDKQDMSVARLAIEFNQLDSEQVIEINIKPMVESFSDFLPKAKIDRVRWGNVMARVRMIVIYDLAKSLNALVCGTENKSEKYLGYFTRFGDEASDVEPIQHLYKTQVKQLAIELQIPTKIISQPPSAGLWSDQTDEAELGFDYVTADQVLAEFVDAIEKYQSLSIELQVEQIALATNLEPTVVRQVIDRVQQNKYKQTTPIVFNYEV